MNSIDRILDNVQKEVELYGRSGRDSIFLDNYHFSIPSDQFQVPGQANEDECVNDVAWFFSCARKSMALPHPAPDRSFWIKRFGKDALPYGPTWNLKKLVETIKSEDKERQAILSNGIFMSSPPCILLYQFQQLDFGLLDMTVYLRGSDVSNVLPQDVLMSQVILEEVCQLVDLRPGKMTFFIGNAHVFYQDTMHQEEYTIEFGG